MSARIRCAIYSRKSSEEGLEQDFNSLHAQREACQAFIKSQQGLGWVALPAAYDDGGISGGTMERPALRRLLVDIAQRKVDLVVVYKVDRLTRSLADFAKIVEVFDTNGVSFVSVTQQFNTTTSMGRLTLNMLLSFAQFEREVTGERIRDKVAASKKKGMWMGGPVPLGYDVRDKRLVVNAKEAATVRSLFRLYIELGTVKKLVEHARQLKLVTKRRQHPDGRVGGGRPFTRGHLYQLLSNPLYLGEVAHRDARYPGRHKPIVERALFEAVQRQLQAHAVRRHAGGNARAPSLLAGLVYDERGDRLCPTHANKKGRRYCYYIAKRLMHRADPGESGWRLPARELEAAVTGTVATFLRDEAGLVKALKLDSAPSRLRTMLNRAGSVADDLLDDRTTNRRAILQQLIERVTVEQEALRIALKRVPLFQAIQPEAIPKIRGQETISLTAPFLVKRRGMQAKLILGGFAAPPRHDPILIAAVAQAHRWLGQLVAGDVGSIDQIAIREKRDASDVGRQIRLAFLAPDIVEAVLAGSQPVELTARRVRHIGALPLDWHGQRRRLGFER